MKEELAKKIVYTIIFFLALGMIITMFQSCRTSGYGCHGNYTWKQMVKKNNKMY